MRKIMLAFGLISLFLFTTLPPAHADLAGTTWVGYLSVYDVDNLPADWVIPQIYGLIEFMEDGLFRGRDYMSGIDFTAPYSESPCEDDICIDVDHTYLFISQVWGFLPVACVLNAQLEGVATDYLISITGEVKHLFLFPILWYMTYSVEFHGYKQTNIPWPWF